MRDLLPAGVGGLVFAAALAALMSNASGALIACSAVSTTDILGRFRFPRASADGGEVGTNRLATLVSG